MIYKNYGECLNINTCIYVTKALRKFKYMNRLCILCMSRHDLLRSGCFPCEASLTPLSWEKKRFSFNWVNVF